MAADPSEGDLGTIAMSECHPHEHAPNVEDSLVDPFNSPREYHFHPHTRHQREIWRPGTLQSNGPLTHTLTHHGQETQMATSVQIGSNVPGLLYRRSSAGVSFRSVIQTPIFLCRVHG
jgi:hydroxyacyl-ACP dehydratase HTD2-like protein with hotdog domain